MPTTEVPKMHHCIHCLQASFNWLPASAAKGRNGAAYTGCSSTGCALRNGSKGCCCDENDNSWEPLSSEHVQLLEAFYAHQICDWKSDAEYLSDSFVVDFHSRLDRAYTKIKAATHNSHVTASTTDQDTIEHALAIENLRVQIDISNSLRGIFKTLHRRDAYSSLSNGKLELKRGYPTLPPRVGPDALPQRFFLETGQVDGIKRSAPGSDGKDAGGGKKPKTK
ncbi:hypothetical protein FOCG_11675 [Fusarium oxysporum f. sp. radicis-lycopersici 26381]|uniref:Uncharacterized protein n=2 Tax=Fusarium oxysporum TaxID=5507 RepID=A0A420Q950_FUSOX|nr:hypothetical protein FOCG_11675 [Fusarium oxysporum f. sp. radicis-lycopersici 26381]KAF5266441.1 hypothetical protein FOXYS1_2700 [Fusarium oxysporum]PCD42787.1 hypothetical protein AU210_005312 [Fusarium oxysporum f. sp. radicis-cucumerinum]RKL01339.1 hypothetical protein BFJ71_g5119 [Fusarium oxysporum]RKL16517.1 hypothetical protein BFJ68_g5131 [Fusarium oxysporum]